MEKYLHAISLHPTYAPAYYNIGVMYPSISTNYYYNSWSLFIQILFLHNCFCYRYSELGKYEEALNYYHQAIQHNPYYVESFCNCGVIYKNMGKLEEAI